MVSEHSCIKIDDDLPLETVALVGCGVPTGWGTAVNAGGVRPGDTTVIYGIGGVGINAVQGAAFAGARNVIAVDPLEFKREHAMEFGATHVAAAAAAAQDLVTELTRGVGADQALITVGVVTEEVIASAFAAVRKRGTVVITGLAGRARRPSSYRRSSSPCSRSGSRARCSAAVTRSTRSRAARAVPGRAAQARRAGHHPVPPGRRQPGLP